MRAAKRTLDEWAVIISDMRASGMTQKEWCERHGINFSSLIKAQSRLKGQTRKDALQTTPFVRACVALQAQKITFRVGAISVQTTPNDAAAILKVLAGEVPC